MLWHKFFQSIEGIQDETCDTMDTMEELLSPLGLAELHQTRGERERVFGRWIKKCTETEIITEKEGQRMVRHLWACH